MKFKALILSFFLPNLDTKQVVDGEATIPSTNDNLPMVDAILWKISLPGLGW